MQLDKASVIVAAKTSRALSRNFKMYPLVTPKDNCTTWRRVEQDVERSLTAECLREIDAERLFSFLLEVGNCDVLENA